MAEDRESFKLTVSDIELALIIVLLSVISYHLRQ